MGDSQKIRIQRWTVTAVCASLLMAASVASIPAASGVTTEAMQDAAPDANKAAALRQAPFVDLVNEIMLSEPDNYAASEVVDDGSGWISFAHVPSADTSRKIEASGVTVQVSSDAPASRQEIDETLPTVAEYLTSIGHDDARIEASKDLRNLTIVLSEPSINQFRETSSTETATPTLDTELSVPEREAVASLLPPGMALTTTATAEAPLQDQTAYAGMGLQDANGPNCTIGFAVKRGNNSGSPIPGLLTAGHCPRGIQSGTTFANNDKFEFVDVVPANFGDVQFMKTVSGLMGNGILNSQWENGSSWTYPRAAKESVVGERLCFKGRTMSDHNCTAKVVEVDVCVSGFCSLVKTDGTFTSNGDSGGPWTSAAYGEALGIHKGATSTNSYYSRVTRALAYLSAYLGTA